MACLYGDNLNFIEEIYQRYLQNDKSIGEDWSRFFADNCYIKTNGTNFSNNAQLISELMTFFRSYGHFFSHLNPLSQNREVINYQKYSNLQHIDSNRSINLNGLFDKEESTVGEFVAILQGIYCDNIGFELMHLSSYEERAWLQDKIENRAYILSKQDKVEILQHLIKSEMFEQFLHIKFPGYKRFSIEGGESAIVALERIIKKSFSYNIEEIVFGISHRGRLTILTQVIGKEYSAMLSEFHAHSNGQNRSGDVKYHLGYSADRIISDNQKIYLNLCCNPSHLESINPVLVGRVRAKQETKPVLAVSIHGDAAFAGQGVVAETLSLSNIEGYRVDGTIHIIINNQIGFTANTCYTRSSFYCTDIAKSIEIPVFHVNGDDPEAVDFVTSLAIDYRQKFKKDIVINIVCYRKYGHNEADEPSFTQPLMYKLISERSTPGQLYEKKLVKDKIINSDEANEIRKEFRAKLDASLIESTNLKAKEELQKIKSDKCYVDYSITKSKLKELGICINSNIPNDFNIHPKVQKIFDSRLQSIISENNIDWATAESLAFASLLTQGVKVRLSGQDSSRGTFSQRHAKIIDQVTEELFIPLNNINEDQVYFEVIDSPLSEYAAMGFEYGYSLDSACSLVLWEGQFGDFANGAQIIIDQFISCAETKWSYTSNLVLLLPHGYEGQGAEHSSARIERFLQLCAEDNMQVINCSTPANYFHALRRQIYSNSRKPLIIFTPKSLLRHRRATSCLSDFTDKFLTVIPECRRNLVANDAIRKVIMCSGKIYYDIVEACEAQDVDDISIIRLEQFYPFPDKKLACELKKYKNAKVVWCQEEPQNMGGWPFVSVLIEQMLSKPVAYIARPASASTACGNLHVHIDQQKKILEQVLN